MENGEYNQKNSLFNAMSRFLGAVDNMDQTVMVPSLLRDVRQEEAGAAYFQQDMYSSYVLLKSIRSHMEWGALQGEGLGGGAQAGEDDLEKQLHFHLDGLHGVLSKLTRKANTLTSRYKEEIGCRD